MAGSFDDAMADYARGDYRAALPLLRSLAESGNAAAQSQLGFMYSAGVAVPQNDAEAARWVRRAAEQGNPDAQYGMGVLYLNGKGELRDDAEAAKWFRKAAGQGHVESQSTLGLMYLDGRGVPQH